MLQTIKCTLSQESDKLIIVNNIRKQRALRQFIKSAISNSLTTISQQNARHLLLLISHLYKKVKVSHSLITIGAVGG